MIKFDFSKITNIKPLKNEIWKDIIGYEGFYQISNKGRVKSVSNDKTLIPSKDRYYRVSLCKNNIKKTYCIHKLVAKAFIPNPNNYPEINHIDENRFNNYIENLEWCTRAYNNKYSKNRSVLQYDLQGNFIKEWESTREAARNLNVNNSNISKCCRNAKGYNTCKGFIWKYK